MHGHGQQGGSFNGAQQQQQQAFRSDLAEGVICPKCNSNVFVPLVVIQRVKGLLVGSLHDQIGIGDAGGLFKCASCGQIVNLRESGVVDKGPDAPAGDGEPVVDPEVVASDVAESGPTEAAPEFVVPEVFEKDASVETVEDPTV